VLGIGEPWSFARTGGRARDAAWIWAGQDVSEESPANGGSTGEAREPRFVVAPLDSRLVAAVDGVLEGSAVARGVQRVQFGSSAASGGVAGIGRSGDEDSSMGGMGGTVATRHHAHRDLAGRPGTASASPVAVPTISSRPPSSGKGGRGSGQPGRHRA
jgi:hypothetical protein